jgi:hypothetical protein
MVAIFVIGCGIAFTLEVAKGGFDPDTLTLYLAFTGFMVVGAVIVAQRPDNAISRIFSTPPQVRAGNPASRAPRSDRDCPPDTAHYRCLWHVSGTAGGEDGAPTRRRRLSARPMSKARPWRALHCCESRRARGGWHQVLNLSWRGAAYCAAPCGVGRAESIATARPHHHPGSSVT